MWWQQTIHCVCCNVDHSCNEFWCTAFLKCAFCSSAWSKWQKKEKHSSWLWSKCMQTSLSDKCNDKQCNFSHSIQSIKQGSFSCCVHNKTLWSWVFNKCPVHFLCSELWKWMQNKCTSNGTKLCNCQNTVAAKWTCIEWASFCATKAKWNVDAKFNCSMQVTQKWIDWTVQFSSLLMNKQAVLPIPENNWVLHCAKKFEIEPKWVTILTLKITHWVLQKCFITNDLCWLLKHDCECWAFNSFVPWLC